MHPNFSVNVPSACHDESKNILVVDTHRHTCEKVLTWSTVSFNLPRRNTKESGGSSSTSMGRHQRLPMSEEKPDRDSSSM
jgi:hypothetical protein